MNGVRSPPEADFYEADVDFPWGRTTAHVMAVRSEFSGASLLVAYPSENQAALFEAITLALEFLGGVFKLLRFDNLKPAVKRIVWGCRRVEQDRFIAFRSHYLFESSFTTPGKEGAHEKGGVEGENGRFRRRWLTPVPKVASWDELNSYLRACCLKDLNRTIEGKATSVAEDQEMERSFLKPLPKERFETAEITEPTVDQKARVKIRTNRYSVPASLIGSKVSARISALTITISYQGRIVATHERLHLKNAEHLVLDHYLELLHAKPGAFPGSEPLHQARSRGEFPPDYDKLWAHMRTHLGDKAGTRAMIEVLLLHRKHPAEAVHDAVSCALEIGTVDPGTVALIARNCVTSPSPEHVVIDVGDLSRYDRALPDVTGYDALLAQGARR